MVIFTNEVEIDATPHSVFDELSDQRHELRWSPKMRSVELLDGEPIRVGSRLRARWAGTPPNTVVYTEYERPRRWAMRFTSWLMIVETSCDLLPVGEATRLVSTWHMHLRGPLAPLSGVVARGISKDVAESIRCAKAHVEKIAV
jgi:hypothetical protein